MVYPLNQTVEAIGKIAFEGNLIPNEWYQHLENDKGKIQINSLILLAEIVYWYRPTPIYDIHTGKIADHGRKFKGDLLQKNYNDLMKKLHFTKNQLRAAFVFLEKKELVKREFRDIKIGSYEMATVMFISINEAKIEEISRPKHCENTKCKSERKPQQFEKIITPTFQANELNQNGAQNSNSQPLEITEKHLTEITPTIHSSPDWSVNFSEEEKKLLNHLINIKPPIGDPIQPDNASWWIKKFGVEKIKDTLDIYWKQVEKAKNNPEITMPQNIGAYVRKILNEKTLPTESEKNQEGIEKILGGDVKILNNTKNTTKNSSNVSKIIDWSLTFSTDQKKYLNFLLKIVPEKGSLITKDAATWWIRHYGIEKTKTALQVYWQQVEKAKKNPNVPMPTSIGAYVRKALNEGTRPCQEQDKRNKAFAEQFKTSHSWHELTITEKYCRMEGIGKEWYYFLPEHAFHESLMDCYELYREQKAI